MTNRTGIRCICPLDPADTVNGYPRAVKDCKAHRARYLAQQDTQRLTRRHWLTLALVVAVSLLILYLMVAAWPATVSPDPIVTPTTYGAPGPNGGPR